MRAPLARSLIQVKRGEPYRLKMRINIIPNDPAMKMNQEGSAPALARAAALPAAIGLDTLPRQTPATVSALRTAQSAADQDVVLRLMEIGFLPGEPVRVVATGFLGGEPIAVRVGQATFALRRHEAALVQVQVEGATA